MLAFAFNVLVGNISAVEEIMEDTVVFQQEILSPAAHIDIGELFVFGYQLVHQSFGAVRAIRRKKLQKIPRSERGHKSKLLSSPALLCGYVWRSVPFGAVA